MRVPNAGKSERESQTLIRRLERKLSYFQSIPSHRRADECAYEGEGTCRTLLADLGAPGHERSRQTSDGGVTLMTVEKWLADV